MELLLEGPAQSRLHVDHVLCGTGYRIGLERLGFLPDGIRSQISAVNGYPTVARTGESSLPGLYFVGAPTAVSIGPSARFIAGTHNMSAKAAQAVAHRAKAAPRVSRIGS